QGIVTSERLHEPDGNLAGETFPRVLLILLLKPHGVYVVSQEERLPGAQTTGDVLLHRRGRTEHMRRRPELRTGEDPIEGIMGIIPRVPAVARSGQYGRELLGQGVALCVQRC